MIFFFQSNRIDEQRAELPLSLRNSAYIPPLVIGKTENSKDTEEASLHVSSNAKHSGT